MKVLSLFDGISCARVALERVGIPVEAYYASEIDKYAMQISAKNYPDIVQLGDIKSLADEIEIIERNWTKNIDLLIGGSPCQDLSIAKKDRKGLEGERSGLFWEYVRILKEVKPKYFILENVNSMPKEAKAIITETLGVEPIMINASLVSAQNRKRLFWFGQTRERFNFNDVLCYNCLYKNSRIQTKSQDKGSTEILGSPQKRCGDLQNMPEGISEDKSTGYNKNLLGRMSEDKQETERQKSGQEETISISERISKSEQTENTGIPQELSSIKDRQRENGDSRQTTTQINREKNEKSLPSGTHRNKKENNKRGSDSDIKNEAGVCCLQCNKGLDDRPFNTFIERGNERFREPTNLMSEVQFNKARQNNGRIFDVYKVNVTLPGDRGILLKDILEQDVDEKYFVIQKDGSEKLKSNTIRTSGRGSGVDDKHNWDTIRIGQIGKGGQEVNTQIRKLTSIERERLQGVPYNYTEGVSNNQRYKMLGNAFNCDVVAHILSYIKEY